MTKNLILVFVMFSVMNSYSQEFLDGSFTFSKKKESYLTLKDGQEIVGYIDDIDRKKGLIEEITIKDEKKKKMKFKPSDIKHMYIAPSGFDKMSSVIDKAYDATKWNDDKSAHANHIKNGYVFFETTDVMIKKKKMTLLLQLLNPGFANGIKVYFDPFAKETASLGVGGINVVGGDAKSYYFKKADAVAFKMEKKNYDKEFKNLYGDCQDLMKEFSEKNTWKNVEKHVFFYSENCK